MSNINVLLVKPVMLTKFRLTKKLEKQFKVVTNLITHKDHH